MISGMGVSSVATPTRAGRVEQPKYKLSGSLGRDYQLFPLVVPHYNECHLAMAQTIASLPSERVAPTLPAVEIGTGHGIGTRLLLENIRSRPFILNDFDHDMLRVAEQNLVDHLDRITFAEEDALDYLSQVGTSSVAAVASAWTTHNWDVPYRNSVTEEIARVLVPGGVFVNCDKYWGTDLDEELDELRSQFSRFFEHYMPLGRLDLVRDWIDHYLQDGLSVRRLQLCNEVRHLKTLGFNTTSPIERQGLETILLAERL